MEDPRPSSSFDPRATVEVRAAARHAREVLFLCSGNIMRSAFAELYARHLACPLPVRSAGTTYENDSLHPATARALARRGVARDSVAAFRPTYLPRGSAAGAATLIFGMTRSHLLGQPPRQAFLATSLLGGRSEIEDPIAHSDPERVFAEVARCVESLVAVLRA